MNRLEGYTNLGLLNDVPTIVQQDPNRICYKTSFLNCEAVLGNILKQFPVTQGDEQRLDLTHTEFLHLDEDGDIIAPENDHTICPKLSFDMWINNAQDKEQTQGQTVDSIQGQTDNKINGPVRLYLEKYWTYLHSRYATYVTAENDSQIQRWDGHVYRVGDNPSSVGSIGRFDLTLRNKTDFYIHMVLTKHTSVDISRDSKSKSDNQYIIRTQIVKPLQCGFGAAQPTD